MQAQLLEQCSVSSAALLIAIIMRRRKGLILVHSVSESSTIRNFFGLRKYMCYPVA